MARTIGARNKIQQVDAVFTLTTEQRVQLLATLLLEIIIEEIQCTPT